LSLEAAVAERFPRVPLERAARLPRARRRLDWFELALLGAFALVSVWVAALDLWQVVAHGRAWTGADSLWGVDQFQYQAWVRAASQHFLVSNLFVLHPTPADYFQPAIVISGALTALGVAPWLSLLLWKPVAVAAVFFAVREYLYRTVRGRPARAAALALALFFGSFTIVYGSVGPIGDLFDGFLAWGYPFALLGLAAMVAALLTYDRARSDRRISWMPGLLGAAASSVHPWNGALLIAAVLGAELVIARGGRVTRGQLALPIRTLAMTAIPLAYYVLLGKADPSWQLAQAASKHSFPLWSITLELAPLLLPALLAYRKYPRTFLGAATMVWPVAAFALFAISTTRFAATPVHAFQGITLPLAVLAIAGLRDIGFGRLRYSLVLGSLLVAAFTVPATISELKLARQMVAYRPGDNNFIRKPERRALDYLARDRRPGGVVTRVYLGELVPGVTGRRTFVGDCLWSQPNCPGRMSAVHDLFTGNTTPVAARRFVAVLASRKARFLLQDCESSADLGKLIAPLIVSVHHFGCASVYEIR
jgi:hypothetical protein